MTKKILVDKGVFVRGAPRAAAELPLHLDWPFCKPRPLSQACRQEKLASATNNNYRREVEELISARADVNAPGSPGPSPSLARRAVRAAGQYLTISARLTGPGRDPSAPRSPRRPFPTHCARLSRPPMPKDLIRSAISESPHHIGHESALFVAS
jgi:hypothetical protein